ncbi:Radical SAM domain protein [Methanothrix harundinacea 6Ac]|uniref:Radical SAM domain protein n=2 Tax=Methanothrix harundinacea TaxID=301375 RepID=G7WN85_METH6|nr:Radical SAM domain protein [Methanothrix harundinacea 6Ac]
MLFMTEALFYDKLDGGAVRCGLCNHFCRIKPEKRGICGVRENYGGVLKTLVYGRLIAMHVDPIEKKPLYHFMPGHLSYSIATVGCNFRCLHCQNADISQIPAEGGAIRGERVEPERVVAEALSAGCRSVAYTYTEPTIFFEYALDVSRLAADRGLKNVFVSNGYMSEEATRTIEPYLDAINVDLKGNDGFYRKVCGARLDPVKRTIELMWGLGIWVEVTTLVIPGYNDSDEDLREIAEFLSSVSPEIPWHVTAFYPTYRLKDAPPTPAKTIRRAEEIGRGAGLNFVYAGNIPGEGENTTCPACGETLVERFGFRVARNGIVDGRCPSCGEGIPGVW